MPHDPERMQEYERAIAASMLATKFINAHPGCRIACGHSLGRNKLFFVVFGDAYSHRHEIEVPPDAPGWAIEVAIASGWLAVQQGACNTIEPETDVEREPEPVDTYDTEERAAIMEFDGGLSRPDAEARAVPMIVEPEDVDPYIQEAVANVVQPEPPTQWDDW